MVKKRNILTLIFLTKEKTQPYIFWVQVSLFYWIKISLIVGWGWACLSSAPLHDMRSQSSQLYYYLLLLPLAPLLTAHSIVSIQLVVQISPLNRSTDRSQSVSIIHIFFLDPILWDRFGQFSAMPSRKTNIRWWCSGQPCGEKSPSIYLFIRPLNETVKILLLILSLVSLCDQWLLTVFLLHKCFLKLTPTFVRKLCPKPAEWLCTMCAASKCVTWSQAEKQTQLTDPALNKGLTSLFPSHQSHHASVAPHFYPFSSSYSSWIRIER